LDVGQGPVAVTGANGRLGRALSAALTEAGYDARRWQRPQFDLDKPRSVAGVVMQHQPTLVYHCAAWTDVDGCAREPALAMLRNSEATEALALACASAGAGLVYLSTNEVFDGDRRDGHGYREQDEPSPGNAYGRSKLAGELAVEHAFSSRVAREHRFWIVRASWLFGPPGNDFPTKIVAAARALAPAGVLRVVEDEHGRPTLAADLAMALLRLPQIARPGIYHLANGGVVSRFEWARRTVEQCVPGTSLSAIAQADYQRPSRPPRWGVLDTGLAESLGISLRPWPEAFADYLPELCAK
jgi:dTDP-4-dehydrorhamnose reductase